MKNRKILLKLNFVFFLLFTFTILVLIIFQNIKVFPNINKKQFREIAKIEEFYKEINDIEKIKQIAFDNHNQIIELGRRVVSVINEACSFAIALSLIASLGFFINFVCFLQKGSAEQRNEQSQGDRSQT